MTETVFHVDPRNAKCDQKEVAIQTAFRKRMRTLAPSILLVGIPNSGKRTAWESRERAREGMVKGFPDMLAMHDGRTLGLEFKTGKGTISPQQHDVLNKLVALRFPVGVFRSADTAVEWVQNHMPSAFVGRLT